MKKFTILCGLVAAFLCLAQNASAQYATEIHRDRAGFTDQVGRPLTDAELIDLIGPEIYRETVVGARKQYNAGRKLITGGAIGVGAGLITMYGGILIVYGSVSAASDISGQRYVDRDQEAAGYLIFGLGVTTIALGGLALDAGIPLHIIGKSRLNWVENDFNERSHAVTARFGAAPHGIGLTMTF